jgi:hypothetical protein
MPQQGGSCSRGADFSTSLRYARNDRRRAPCARSGRRVATGRNDSEGTMGDVDDLLLETFKRKLAAFWGLRINRRSK